MSGVSNAVVQEFKKKAAAATDIGQSAFNNELLTRQRVDALEALLSRSFLGRLRWLLRGR